MESNRVLERCSFEHPSKWIMEYLRCFFFAFRSRHWKPGGAIRITPIIRHDQSGIQRDVSSISLKSAKVSSPVQEVWPGHTNSETLHSHLLATIIWHIWHHVFMWSYCGLTVPCIRTCSLITWRHCTPHTQTKSYDYLSPCLVWKPVNKTKTKKKTLF